MGYAKRTDSNQTEIVNALRKCGCSVYITSMVGNGFTDIVFGFCGLNFLGEIKDGKKPPSARKLTIDEKKFHEEWKGQVCILESVEQAIAFVNSVRKECGKQMLQGISACTN